MPKTGKSIAESDILASGGRYLGHGEHEHAKLVALLKPNERLGMLLRYTPILVLSDVTDSEAFADRYNQFVAGGVGFSGFYAVTSGYFD